MSYWTNEDCLEMQDDQFYEREVQAILERSSAIKRSNLNKQMLLICVRHMRVDSEEEAWKIACRLSYSEEYQQDLMRYWKYCYRMGSL
jgi:hypothetical protein